jgi:hypothetical protein
MRDEQRSVRRARGRNRCSDTVGREAPAALELECDPEPPNRSVQGLKFDPDCVGIRVGRVRDPELVQRVEQLYALGA